MAQKETIGFRCSEISQRHRVWGEVPTCELDFLVVEYDRREPVALVD